MSPALLWPAGEDVFQQLCQQTASSWAADCFTNGVGASQLLWLTEEEGRRFTQKAWKGGGGRKSAKNNPDSSTLKFLWMRFCQGSGNRKGKRICFPSDSVFSSPCSHRGWQKYTKQYGPAWHYPKATQIRLVQRAEWKWSWLVIGSGDQLRLFCSVRTVCSCQFPLNKTQITICKSKKHFRGFLNSFLLQNRSR